MPASFRPANLEPGPIDFAVVDDHVRAWFWVHAVEVYPVARVEA